MTTMIWFRRGGIAALLIISACILIVAASWNESLTFDEVTYIPSGYSYITRGDMRINPEHPPLFKDLAAFPLLFMDIKQGAFDTPSWTTNTNDQWEFGKTFLFQSGNDAIAIARATRLPMLFFFIVSAALVFVWTNMRFGLVAAYIALIVFSFSPTIMAHSGFVVNDIAAMCGALAGSFAFANFIRRPTWKRAVLTGIVLGFAILTKFSTVLLLPLFVSIVAVYAIVCWHHHSQPLRACLRIIAGSFAKLFLIIIIALVVIVYPIYTAHVWNYPPDRQRHDSEVIMSVANTLPTELLSNLADNTLIRPFEYFMLGIVMNMARTHAGNEYYFNSTISKDASPLYFPVAYATKEPLPWLILIGMTVLGSLFVFIWRLMSKKEVWRHISHFNIASFAKKYSDEIIIGAWIIGYGTVSISGNLNIGIRHILPLYPFIIMLGAAAIAWLLGVVARHNIQYGRVARLTVWLLLGWYIIESLVAFPFYLPYFNQLVGGSKNGGAYFTDSNLDWGQDLARLRIWLDEHKVQKIEGDFFTSADPAYYLADRYILLKRDTYSSVEAFKQNGHTEWLAISEGVIRDAWTRGNGYLWLREHEPTTIIGHSIRVYHLPRN